MANYAQEDLGNLLTLVLSNQHKQMAATQVILLQQSQLIARLAKVDLLAVVEDGDRLYREELNKLQIAGLAELRVLKGGSGMDASGGMMGGAG